jgi:hypothetical protein
VRAPVLLCSTLLACGGSADLEPVEQMPEPPDECLERGDEDDDAFRSKCFAFGRHRRVDLLFVVDDGPDAAALQTRLADAMDELAASVEAMDPAPELRIGFTSSRDPNPICATGLEGGAGRLMLSSCVERPETFVDAEGTDRFAELCADRCEIGELETTPTSLDPGEEARSRPWIDLLDSQTNLADGVALADAMRCASLLGVAGCPFAAPIGATRYALLRAEQDEDAPEHGFFRRDAAPIIVWVTSGVECSQGPATLDAFDPEGSRALWTDPEVATPGLCWNAGVECSAPDAEGISTCAPRDVDLEGAPAMPDAAVLEPLEGPARLLEDTHEHLFQYRGDAELRVLAITGTPPAWEGGDLPVLEPADAEVAASHGVQPTCTIDGDALVPPVRHAALLALPEVAAIGEHVIASGCTDDFSPFIAQIADAIREAMPPTCMPTCVADIDPEKAGVQSECRVEAQVPLDGKLDAFYLAECGPSDDGAPVIPSGEPGCFAARTGATMHPRCVAEGYNIEFDLVWDGPLPEGASFQPSCKLSQDKERDCPDL